MSSGDENVSKRFLCDHENLKLILCVHFSEESK